MAQEIYMVVGGSGMVGRHIVEALQQRGEQVVVFDIVQTYDGPTFYTGDIAEDGVFLKALQQSNATCIFHVVSPHQGRHAQFVYDRVNVIGTQNMINAAIKCGVRKFVYTSSAGVVFAGKGLENADESYPYADPPIDPYNASKAKGEQLVLASDGRGGMYTVAIRPSIIFGRYNYLNIAPYQKQYDDDVEHFQIGDDKHLTDFCYASNVADAHVLAADQLLPDRSDVHGQAFFVSNGEPVPFWDFGRRIYASFRNLDPEYYSRPPRPVTRIPENLGYLIGLISELWGWLTGTQVSITRYRVLFIVNSNWHNIDKIKNTLGYEPRVSVDEGIRKMCEWWVGYRKIQQSKKSK